MYDPATSRWLSSDPIKGVVTNPQSLNLYAYVLNNPLKYVDPFGLQENPMDILRKLIDDPSDLSKVTHDKKTYYWVSDVFIALGGTTDYDEGRNVSTLSLAYKGTSVKVTYTMDDVPRIGRWIFNRGINNSIISATGEYTANGKTHKIDGSLPILYRNLSKKTYVNLNDLFGYFKNLFCESNFVTPAPSPMPTPTPTPPSSPAPRPSVPLTEDQKVFFSVIAAEAGAQGQLAWQCVANIVQNRWFNKRDSWRNATSVIDIVANKSQFNGYQDPNYQACYNYLNNRTGNNKTYEGIIETTMPYFELRGQDILDGAVLFYSPQSMIPAGSAPRWDFSLLQEITVAGINQDEFRFFKYR